MSFNLYTLNTDTMTHKKSCVMSPTPSTWSEQTSEHNRSPVPGPHIWMLVSLMTFIITHPSKLIVLTASCTAPGLYLSASLPPPTFSLQSFSRTPHPHCHPPPVGQPSRAPPCPWGCLWQRRWRPLPPPMPAAQHPAAQPPRHQAPPPASPPPPPQQHLQPGRALRRSWDRPPPPGRGALPFRS